MTKTSTKKTYKVVMRKGKAKPGMLRPKTLHSKFAAKKGSKRA